MFIAVTANRRQTQAAPFYLITARACDGVSICRKSHVLLCDGAHLRRESPEPSGVPVSWRPELVSPSGSFTPAVFWEPAPNVGKRSLCRACSWNSHFFFCSFSRPFFPTILDQPLRAQVWMQLAAETRVSCRMCLRLGRHGNGFK